MRSGGDNPAKAGLGSVYVQCGSRAGVNPTFTAAAARLGETLAAVGIRVIFGGVGTGLMGSLARSVLEHGGQIVGVVPGFLVEAGLAHSGLSDLRVVSTMNERKAVMLELSDAMIVLPGGVGTQDEFWEVLAGAQLGMHRKPCGILNVEGYYDSLLAFIDRALSEGLLSATDKGNILVSEDPEELIGELSRKAAERMVLASSAIEEGNSHG